MLRVEVDDPRLAHVDFLNSQVSMDLEPLAPSRTQVLIRPKFPPRVDQSSSRGRLFITKYIPRIDPSLDRRVKLSVIRGTYIATNDEAQTGL